MAPSGNPVVQNAKQRHCAGNARHPGQRPRPPDFLRERDSGVGAAVLAAIVEQQPHLAKQFVTRYSEQRCYTRILQRRNIHPAPPQNRGQASRDTRAKSTFRVEEKPAARVSPFCIREFRG